MKRAIIAMILLTSTAQAQVVIMPSGEAVYVAPSIGTHGSITQPDGTIIFLPPATPTPAPIGPRFCGPLGCT